MGVSDLAKEIWVSTAAVGGFFRGHDEAERETASSRLHVHKI